ncbi:MAG: hypothetical protein H7A38_02410 [Chlamydiales bacterium]|nr:hypothetical protein [Chlamydiales bacterium]
MGPYIPTLAAATAATSIFHLPKILPAPTAATLAQLSTAIGLFVLRSTATTTPKHAMRIEQDEEYTPRSYDHYKSYFSKAFLNEKLAQLRDLSPSKADFAWTALSTGVLAGIGYFFQDETRNACFKAGAAMGLLQGVVHWWQPDLLTALSSQDELFHRLDGLFHRLDGFEHKLDGLEESIPRQHFSEGYQPTSHGYPPSTTTWTNKGGSSQDLYQG